MGMELRISEIRNQKAQRAAHMVDNGDGLLKKDELSIFQTKAAEIGVSNRVINDIVDRFNSEEATAEKEPTRKEQKAEKVAAAQQEVETIASEVRGEDGRYTQEVLNQTRAKLEEDGRLNRQERQALRNFRDTAIARDAQGVILDAIMAQSNTEIEGSTGNPLTASGQDVETNEDLTRKSHIKKEAKADLKENGAWDDKAVRQEWRDGRGEQLFTGERSFVDAASRIQAAQNDVEQSVIQTTEEVIAELGTDNMELVNSLNGKTVELRDFNGKPIEGETISVAYKDENGNWHFDGLSQEIEHIIGADLELNRDAKKDKLVAEFTKIHGRLNLLAGKKLSKAEVRELVKLCGYDIEPKDWRKIVANTVTLGLAGAVSGAVGSGGDKSVLLPDEIIDVDNYFKIPELVDVTVDTTITIPGETLVVPGNVGTAAALGIVLPAVIGLLNGLKDPGQKPVVPQNFSANSPQALIDELKSEKNPYADVFGVLALAFRTQDETGKVTGWDREGFKDFLNDIAGNGNLLNKKELLGAQMRIENGEYTVKTEETDSETENEEVCAVEITEDTPVKEETEDITYIHSRKGGDSWAGIVTAYYPDLVAEFGLWGKDGAIKRLQRELAKDENGEFNTETFRAIITATDLPKQMKLPSEIEGKARIIGQVKAVQFTTGGKYRSALDMVGNNEYDIRQVPGTTTYIARDLCDPTKTASGSSRQEAFDKLQEANPDKKYQMK